jgi:hypothetical protein
MAGWGQSIGAAMGLAYQQLNGAERAVWDAIGLGDLVDPPGGEPVRAQVLCQLLVAADQAPAVARTLRLRGAGITGTLDLEAASLRCPLVLQGCSFEGPVNLNGVRAPAIRLPGCDAPELIADQVEIDSDLDLSGFDADGAVSLRGAHVGGELSFAGARLHNPDGYALFADSLLVEQDMDLIKAVADGEVLVGGHVRGLLNLHGARLNNRGKRALSSAGLVVDKAVFLRGGFTAEGEVHLPAARIGGRLFLDNATFVNAGKVALELNKLTVDQDMFCRGLTVRGTINLHSAQVGGQLDFSEATLTDPDHEQVSLAGQNLRAAGLVLGWQTPPAGQVDLSHAHVGVLVDPEEGWPQSLGLRDFVYDVLDERPEVKVKDRLGWLRRDPRGYAPQPYEQLAAVYRRAGRDEDARRVAIEKQRRRRTTLPAPAKAWGLVLDGLVGYGYRTWLAALWLLGFLALGTWIFAAAHPQAMTPTKPPNELPAFQPAVYAADVLLPIVDLRQQDAWLPHGFALWWSWVSILVGWILTTAVVAALTGILKRD